MSKEEHENGSDSWKSLMNLLFRLVEDTSGYEDSSSAKDAEGKWSKPPRTRGPMAMNHRESLRL
jgi:hypothetical protein